MPRASSDDTTEREVVAREEVAPNEAGTGTMELLDVPPAEKPLVPTPDGIGLVPALVLLNMVTFIPAGMRPTTGARARAPPQIITRTQTHTHTPDMATISTCTPSHTPLQTRIQVTVLWGTQHSVIKLAVDVSCPARPEPGACV